MLQQKLPRLDLLDCEDILLCCSGSNGLIFTEVALKTSLEAAYEMYMVRTRCQLILVTNGDQKFGHRKVEVIGGYVFNCSRLFQ